jgi:uncharacterized coiled-coil DUF342 family protein
MTTEDTENTERENDLQCELAAWELLREAKRERDEARTELDEVTAQRDHAETELRKLIDFSKSVLGERDEAREVASGLSIQEERVSEAQKELSSIHRWIERNHADGFIDSLTYSQNLERVTDNWYDRIDAIETDARRFVRERDEAITRRMETIMQCELYEQERDEARADAAQLANRLSGLELRTTEELAILERERDEAREALKFIDMAIFEMKPRNIMGPTMGGRYPCWSVWLPKNGRVERKSLSLAVLEFIDQLKEGAK